MLRSPFYRGGISQFQLLGVMSRDLEKVDGENNQDSWHRLATRDIRFSTSISFSV